MTTFLDQLGTWFFVRGDARTAALLRIAFSSTVLLILWDLYPVMDLLFGHAGLYGTLEPYPYRLDGISYLLFHADSWLGLRVWFWSSVLVSLLALLGIAPRLNLALTYFSMFLFRERGPFITFGADLVLNCIGLWLLFLETGAAFCLGQKQRQPPAKLVPLWPLRAIQLQVVSIYLITGLAKLQTQPWQDGSAVYYALHVGDVMKAAPAAWLLAQRWPLIVMNYGTLCVELLVPFALLYRPLRGYAIAACVALHSSIDLLMSIRFFSLVMYVGLLSFRDDAAWRTLAQLSGPYSSPAWLRAKKHEQHARS